MAAVSTAGRTGFSKKVTPWVRSMVDKVPVFQSSLTRELLAASVTDPELLRILVGK